MSTNNQFDWVGFYKELASKLLQYKINRGGLVDKVKKIFETTGINFPSMPRKSRKKRLICKTQMFIKPPLTRRFFQWGSIWTLPWKHDIIFFT